ncbi:MAG: efflux RND transporter periplasmic adaptor subunit, partial [Sandaracinaceae bacterium]|nr:efflux RND transporter periplasmic adaptor subunit [Sandaracinaceae bacterium]
MRLRAESLPYVEVQEISPASLPIPVRSPGRVAFRDEAVSRVGAPLDGRVQEVHVRIGEHVDAGQPLVTLASPGAASVRAQLVQARVAVRAAEAELERQTAMQERGVGVRSEEVAAEARLAEARALLAGLQSTAAMIGRGSSSAVVVRAPIAGTVLARAATPGASVEAGGDALVELGEPSALRV